jgi:hypothetical protein
MLTAAVVQQLYTLSLRLDFSLVICSYNRNRPLTHRAVDILPLPPWPAIVGT